VDREYTEKDMINEMTLIWDSFYREMVAVTLGYELGAFDGILQLTTA
jgi:hypothetical protein